MTPSEIARAASALRANPEAHHEPVPTADNDDAPLFERHQLIAMAACLVIFVATFLAIYLKTGGL